MFATISKGAIIANANISLVAETCPTCGCYHAIPKEIYDRAREDSDCWIYCPIGHKWHFTQSLKEKLAGAQERARNAESRNIHLQDQYDASERSCNALKGVVTRTKNRISKGICPCCNRYFEKLERHMKTKHPKYVKTK